MGFIAAVFSFAVLNSFSQEVVTIELMATDVVLRSESEPVRSLQHFVKNDKVSTTDLAKLNNWAKKCKVHAMTISQKRTVIFDYRFDVHSYYQMRAHSTISGWIWEYNIPVQFADKRADVFIDTGIISRLYQLAEWSCVLISVLIWMIFMVVAIHRIVKRIRLLDKEISYSINAGLNSPITVKGFDELSHLAYEADETRKQLKAAQEKKKIQEHQQKDFVSGISHDLRTPMTIILNYLELAENSVSRDEAQQYIQHAQERALELRDLTNELFESFLLDSREKIRLTGPELVSSAIGDNLSEMILMLHEDHFETDVTELVFPTERIMFNPAFISRIIANIFSNIEKYAKPGTVISISSENDDDTIGFSFSNCIAYKETSNHGAGIGTKNIRSMMHLMHGSSKEMIDLEKMAYRITLVFPITKDETFVGKKN